MLLFALLILSHTTQGLPNADDVTTPPWASTESQPTTTDVPVTTRDEADDLGIRLPSSLKPLHYLVKLQPFINGNFSIFGYMEVEMEVLEPTSKITLHMADIITKNDTIKVYTPGQATGQGMRIKKHEYDHGRQFYIAHLKKELQKGRKYILSMEFLGYLNDKLHGFYRSTYMDADGNTRNVAVTQFQATDARRAFPCFDEPALKAIFEIHLARESWMTTLSNMPIAETVPIVGQEGWVWDRYEKSVPMSTYLVAFVVSDFVQINTTVNDNVVLRVWARREAIDQAQYAMKVGPKILSFFEEYFDLPFPLPKMDMVALPDFSAGAMENWGLITYREKYLMYIPEVSTPESRASVTETISHELAHQWFGNLVTPVWWDDLWLNEGFATYISLLGVDRAEPTWKVLETSAIQGVHGVFDLDSLESSHKISIRVNHPDDITEVFDGISYQKGASIIRMMTHYLTEATFRKGLTNYLKSLAYKNAVQDDLWKYLTLAAHEDGILPQNVTVKMIMDTWTLQKGYPVIHVKRSLDGTSAILTQERFLVERSTNSSNSTDYKWWVPLTYTTQSEANFNQTQAKLWMKDSEDYIIVLSLPPTDQWVIFNLQETGYYRVNYDDHNWNLIIQQLKKDHRVINPINRAQIIDDAMSVAKAGRLSYDIAIDVYAYLRNEEEYLPWATGVSELTYIETMFKRRSGYGALKRYLLDLVLPVYEAVGFDDKIEDPYLEQKKRKIAVNWACKLGHKDCLGKALTLYRQWMGNADNTSLISPNLKWTVYCRAIEEGGEAEWDFAWDQYLRTNVASEKTLLLAAMACTKEAWILSRYLDMAINPVSGIRLQDVGNVLRSIGYNDVGRSLVWNYLKLNWNDIYTFKKRRRGELMKSITYNFNTKQELQEVLSFLRRRKVSLEGNQRNVQQVEEKVRNNVAWMDANYDVIVQWLEENGYSSKLRIT
ncbi:aminopeptidase N-like [Penaeus monodon]|uniref:aminopeptidase N-like n=1 Tax=Penaeus monodon TaxID=6687 RepID=UPI0018A7C9F1|nr:aminopeptidase N-like [Penaeus monodon]XP_037773441.1 aminopeptidase N-like [Penaeus monodon]XP_037773445.1 aminopeptidase N-like [Penaeus monodon]